MGLGRQRHFDYELVGRWNGYNYVALFPTDVQMIGASKKAQKQYGRIAAKSQEAAASIQPVKKARKVEHIYHWLKLPAGWEESYLAKDEGYCVAFYAKECTGRQKQAGYFPLCGLKTNPIRKSQPGGW